MSQTVSKADRAHEHRRGFTLFEAVVSLGIFLILTSVLLLRYSQFQGTILLTNLAYDIGLSIRQAQVFGVSVRGYTGGANANFNAGYGVRFDVRPGLLGDDNKKYIFFADIDASPPNGEYDAGDAILNTLKLKGGNRISKICVHDGTTNHCGLEGEGDPQPATLDITFIRPDPEALIQPHNVLGDDLPWYGTATIYVRSTNGAERIVKVEPTGQISITHP